MDKASIDKFRNVEPLEIATGVIRHHGMNPGYYAFSGTNFFLIGEGKNRVLIDCGIWKEDEGQTHKAIASIVDYLKTNEASIAYILVTHHHFDHLDGIPILLDKLESELDADVSLIKVLKKLSSEDREIAIVDKIKDRCEVGNVEDGDIIQIDDVEIHWLGTPGHCDDHMWYLLKHTEKDIIFAGDCIIGYSSCSFSNLELYMQTLNRLKDIADDKLLWVGHSVGIEKEYIIMEAKPKIEQYIETRNQRLSEIASAIKSQNGTWTKSKIYEIVYGPRNLPPILCSESHLLITLQCQKLEADGVLSIDSSDPADPLYTLLPEHI